MQIEHLEKETTDGTVRNLDALHHSVNHSDGTRSIGSCQLFVMKERGCSQVACRINQSHIVVCGSECFHELRITGVFLIFAITSRRD